MSSFNKEGDSTGEDRFFIECLHPEQTDTDGFEAKIKNKQGKIYFECPDLKWGDKVLTFLLELQKNEDYEYNSELQNLIDSYEQN